MNAPATQPITIVHGMSEPRSSFPPARAGSTATASPRAVPSARDFVVTEPSLGCGATGVVWAPVDDGIGDAEGAAAPETAPGLAGARSAVGLPAAYAELDAAVGVAALELPPAELSAACGAALRSAFADVRD